MRKTGRDEGRKFRVIVKKRRYAEDNQAAKENPAEGIGGGDAGPGATCPQGAGTTCPQGPGSSLHTFAASHSSSSEAQPPHSKLLLTDIFHEIRRRPPIRPWGSL